MMLSRSKSWRRSIMTSARKLSDLMKLPLIDRSSVSATDVERIWKEYHSDHPNTVAMTMEPWRMKKILDAVKDNPMFMFPVHRPGGFFSMVSQFQFNCCMMTTLEQFQKGDTIPSLTITLYDELCIRKGLGLVRADIYSILTVHEAEQLMTRLIHYYSSAEFNVVRDFNQRPRQFDLNRYLADSRIRWPPSPSSNIGAGGQVIASSSPISIKHDQ